MRADTFREFLTDVLIENRDLNDQIREHENELDRVELANTILKDELEELRSKPAWKWHPYPEEKPVKGKNVEHRGNYLIWTEGGFCSAIEYHYSKGKWNVTDSCEDNEFKDVIAWAEVPEYRRQSDE